jgi:MtrB/PioB family decaheme-associated outer membrane protein
MNGDDSRLTVQRSIPLLLTAVILSMSMRAEAQDAPAVDTSRWTCKYCPFEEGYSLTPGLGAGYVSDDSAKFGEYTGLNEEGAYVVADAQGRYRTKDGLWLDLSAIDLGLDSRYVGIEGGKQGKYRMSFSYKQLPHNISDTAVSPFIGFGTDSLTLPSNWVPAGTTGTMTALDGSLRGVDLETERRLFDLGGSLTPVKHWAFAVNFRHEEKTGTRGTGGSFIFNDSLLPMPVDYKTDQVDISAAYSVPRFHARLAYYGSIFKNDDDALTWANPYVPLGSGGAAGQLALAPDNEFHQLVLSAGYDINQSAQITADIAVGRMTQDETFLPYTINSTLTTQPLPRSSLDGSVDTLSGNVKITSDLTDRLRINAAYTYDDRNNQTSQAVYDWITTDVTAASPRTNLPYSFTHSVAKVDGAYALAQEIRIDAGCAFDEYQRDLQEVDRTHEGSCWGQATIHANEGADIMLMWTHAKRTVSDYIANPEDTPPQNPLMRKYNMADRDRDIARLRVDVALGERTSIGLDASGTWDTYYKSVIGLLDGRSWAAAADAAFAFSDSTSATCYLSHEQIRSSQANAELLAPAPLWNANNEDTIETAGVGLKHQASDKLDLGVDYTYSRSTGEITIEGAPVGFPDLNTRLNSAKLYVSFRMKEKLSLRLTYWYEDYRTEDWALDGVTPSTISNVLAFGQGNPSYHINVITLSGRYEF